MFSGASQLGSIPYFVEEKERRRCALTWIGVFVRSWAIPEFPSVVVYGVFAISLGGPAMRSTEPRFLSATR